MSNFISAMVYGESQLRWLPPGMRDAYTKTRDDAAREGIVIKVNDFGGARTPAITSQLIEWRDEAVRRGEPWYRVSPFSVGKHGVGGAVDFDIVKRPASMTYEQALARVGALAKPHGLLWGGNFSSPADPWHLESQWTREQLQARWNEWVKSPDYPRMGFAEWSVLAVVAAAALLLFLLLRSR